MNIKEIALKVADSLRNKVDGVSHMQSNQGLVRFAEALVAEIAKAEQRVAEACSKLCGSIAETSGHHGATDCESAIDSGEWRKFVKEV